jgi:F0F1-type ATP synthase delta subunit
METTQEQHKQLESVGQTARKLMDFIEDFRLQAELAAESIEDNYRADAIESALKDITDKYMKFILTDECMGFILTNNTNK